MVTKPERILKWKNKNYESIIPIVNERNKLIMFDDLATKY
jgi:hypothetical protein